MDEAALNALRNWKSSPRTSHLLPRSQRLEQHIDGPGSFVARATFEFAGGGRFKLLLSGMRDDKTITPMLENDSGLPDGFLMDVNMFLLTNLCKEGRVLTPEQVVNAALEKANHFFEKHMISVLRKSNASQDASSSSSTDKQDDPKVSREVPAKNKTTHKDVPSGLFGYSHLATATLMKQIRSLQAMNMRMDGFIAQPKEDDLYTWEVKLFFDDESTPLAAGLKSIHQDHVKLEMRFPANYPTMPPFVRVVCPHITGGHVQPRGGLCMQLLTVSGWSPVNTIDAVCIQIRAMIIDGHPRISSSNETRVKAYTFEGALRDLRHITVLHRWNNASAAHTRDVQRS